MNIAGFYHERDMLSHISYIHEGENKANKCRFCKRHFKNELKLENHERIHDGNQNIKWCHLCETAWPNTQNLRFHVKGVHEKQKDHKCNECSKAFVHPSQLKKHISTGIRKFGYFICFQFSESKLAKN